jgi:hypothetical protein
METIIEISNSELRQILNSNEFRIIEHNIQNVHMYDYPDFCDAYFEYLIIKDNKDRFIELTDNQLEQFHDDIGQYTNELIHSNQLY